MTTVNRTIAYEKNKQSIDDVPLGKDDVLVEQFTTPADLGPTVGNGYIGAVQHNAESWNRQFCISETAGDFTPNTAGKHGQPTNYVEGFSPNIMFSQFKLKPSTTYYANLRTVAASQDKCDVRVTLQAR